ncbi:MAG: NAD-dependent succinate-semialdehyde dehydrogenase, partial [Hydrogenophaga sp.]|nr:NAD-dependent succinate-semialdehyde dehydrogenase [Hydrogenophaga sp.]
MSYGDTQLFVNNIWRESRDGRTLPVLNPATGQEIGRVAHAGLEDLVEA